MRVKLRESQGQGDGSRGSLHTFDQNCYPCKIQDECEGLLKGEDARMHTYDLVVRVRMRSAYACARMALRKSEVVLSGEDVDKPEGILELRMRTKVSKIAFSPRDPVFLLHDT